MLVGVLMMLNYHRNVLSLSVLGVLVGEQVVVLIAVPMMLTFHCDMLLLLVLEVLIGEH